MPAQLDTRNSALWAGYNTLGSRILTLRNYCYALATQIGDENFTAAETVLNNMGDYWGSYVKPALCDSGGIKGLTYSPLDWISDNWPTDGDEYELTMQKMLDEIWDATPLEIFFFINYIDAMRAAIWNKEISEEKLHELYRHFSI